NGAAGAGSLWAKNYPAAQKYFSTAVATDPNAPDILGDVYFASIAYLSPKPINPIGLWYAAHAVALSNNNAQINTYGGNKHLRFHSPDASDDHWNEIVAAAKTQPVPPPDFNVPPAPTDREVANGMCGKLNPATADIASLVYMFQYADPQVAQECLTKL